MLLFTVCSACSVGLEPFTGGGLPTYYFVSSSLRFRCRVLPQFDFRTCRSPYWRLAARRGTPAATFLQAKPSLRMSFSMFWITPRAADVLHVAICSCSPFYADSIAVTVTYRYCIRCLCANGLEPLAWNGCSSPTDGFGTPAEELDGSPPERGPCPINACTFYLALLKEVRRRTPGRGALHSLRGCIFRLLTTCHFTCSALRFRALRAHANVEGCDGFSPWYYLAADEVILWVCLCLLDRVSFCLTPQHACHIPKPQKLPLQPHPSLYLPPPYTNTWADLIRTWFWFQHSFLLFLPSFHGGRGRHGFVLNFSSVEEIKPTYIRRMLCSVCGASGPSPAALPLLALSLSPLAPLLPSLLWAEGRNRLRYAFLPAH